MHKHHYLGALPKIAMFLGVGFREELLARGYQLTNLAEGLANTRLGKRGGLILATISQARKPPALFYVNS